MSNRYMEGPWKVVLDGKLWKINGPDGNVCIIAHEQDRKRNKKANAHLIAAAPELLEALENCLPYLGVEERRQAVQLIRKACGEKHE